MKWNADLYEQKHDFVAEYGKDLLSFIPARKEQSILELGCGTGTLTAQLAKLGGRVLGIDGSPEMIERASKEYPKLEFRCIDACNLPFYEEWDVVFSNAVFHWINNHDLLLQNIYRALKPKGLLICEFGVQGNIASIENAFAHVLKSHDHEYKAKFNFPSVKKFEKKLLENNFSIDKIYDFDRPTPLKDGRKGLKNWLRQFFADKLTAFDDEKQEIILNETEELLKDKIWNGQAYYADYRRLRAAAHKEVKMKV